MASDDIVFSMLGVDELLGKFEEISFDVRKKGGRSALRKAALVLKSRLQENAEKIDDPETAEKISNNVDIRFSNRTYKATGDLRFRVGVMGGANLKAAPGGIDALPGKDTRHWSVVEFGAEDIPAQPFARKALADHISEITGTFVDEYNKSLDRAIKRSRKRKAQTL